MSSCGTGPAGGDTIRVILIDTMNAPEYRDLVPTMDNFSALIGGGKVELVPLLRGGPGGIKGVGSFVDTDGRVKKLPMNGLATALVRACRTDIDKLLPKGKGILGPMVILGFKDCDNDEGITECSIPASFMTWIFQSALDGEFCDLKRKALYDE